MKTIFSTLLSFAISVPLLAQGDVAMQRAQEAVAKAEDRLEAAASAGARSYASAIYDEAYFRLVYAKENLSSRDKTTRSLAMNRAVQAWRAAEAAEAKAKYLSTAEQLRSLNEEIVKLGGTARPLVVPEEATVTIERGETSQEKIRVARAMLDRAIAAGAASYVNDELEMAEGYLETATRVAAANENSRSADHLAYVVEMIARRAWYLAQLDELSDMVPELRSVRVDLVQAEMERKEMMARAEREAAERRAAELREQLERERTRREAEQAEIERLRRQVREQQEQLAATLATDRTARAAAERRLDLMRAEYEAALADDELDARQIESLRQRLERGRLELRRLQNAESRSEQILLDELDELRKELRRERERGRVPAEVLAERERFIDQQADEIEQLRRERESRSEERARLEKEFQARVEEAERNMREVTLEQERLREQMQRERERAEEAERELVRVREEMRRREEEAARLESERLARMTELESQLAALAETRREERGFVVTLPGLFFDTGKATLKAGTRSNLAKIAEQVSSVSDVVIVVEGHTDSVGSEAANQSLSERRAIAVRDFLVQEGVSPTVITTIGKGETEPIASNDDASGRARNRRVDLIISMRE